MAAVITMPLLTVVKLLSKLDRENNVKRGWNISDRMIIIIIVLTALLNLNVVKMPPKPNSAIGTAPSDRKLKDWRIISGIMIFRTLQTMPKKILTVILFEKIAFKIFVVVVIKPDFVEPEISIVVMPTR